MTYDIIIIGAGAAGMAAGIGALRENPVLKVLLAERNEKTGKKLYITGKGRCNFTNAADTREFLESVVTNPKFLYSALNALSSADTISLFTSLGMPSKTERGGRVFPESDKSSDVIKALTSELNRLGCAINLNEKVLSIGPVSSGGFSVVSEAYGNESKPPASLGADVRKKQYFSKKVIIATGGLSYPATGSTGDGLRFAEKLGHSIVKPVPALVPLILREVHTLEGLSLRNVRADILIRESSAPESRQEIIASEFGEMLFTKDGVSGPIILSLSSRINRLDPEKLTLSIDLKPALSSEVLDRRILRDFELSPNKRLRNALDGLMPKRLTGEVLNRLPFSRDKFVHQITSMERAALTATLKNMTFGLRSLGDISDGIITSGGVSVKELDPATMESRLFRGLHFAGELIDVDAHTGGYNLQIAFSTGYSAGMAAARSLTAEYYSRYNT